VTITALNIAFAPTAVSLPAGSTVNLTFNNQDNAVSHDFTIFDTAGARLAATEIFAGPATRTLTFTLASPGRYRFTCTVHPREMNGAITAQ
jgi:plastocyanin